MYSHILIPTDGSLLAQKAVAHGLALAKSIGARVTGLTVEATFSVFDVPSANLNSMSDALLIYEKQAKAHAANVLSGVVEAAKVAGVPYETIQVEHDHPYEAIISTAKDKGCDLIVMASHGRSGIAAVLLGSVTNKVLTHTNIPVLVCH
jgi:nucleotide-binding universal stress UspA family protein